MIDEKTGWYFVHTSVKAVVIRDGHVLLCRNPRSEWELPGGWPDRDDTSLADTVVREVREECGIEVVVGDVVHAGMLHVGTDPVAIIALRATTSGDSVPVVSTEHSDVRFFPLRTVPDPTPPLYRDAIRRAADGASDD